MKNLVIALAFLLVPAMAFAEPFVICDDPDPAEQITSYEIFQDGVSIGTTPAPLLFDLAGVTPGQYEFTATAINAWGTSSPSNPYISPTSVSQPSGLNMQP